MHARVPIPRKGSAQHQLFVAVVSSVVTGLQFLNVITYKIPPQRHYLDHPPLMVKDGLIVLLWIKHFKTQKKPLQRLTLCKGFFIMFFLFEAALFGNVGQSFTAEFVFRKRFAPASKVAPRCYWGNVRALLPASAYFLSPTSTFSAPSTTSTVSTVSGARSFVTIVVATSVSTLCCIKRFRGLAPYTGS